MSAETMVFAPRNRRSSSTKMLVIGGGSKMRLNCSGLGWKPKSRSPLRNSPGEHERPWRPRVRVRSNDAPRVRAQSSIVNAIKTKAIKESEENGRKMNGRKTKKKRREFGRKMIWQKNQKQQERGKFGRKMFWQKN